MNQHWKQGKASLQINSNFPLAIKKNVCAHLTNAQKSNNHPLSSSDLLSQLLKTYLKRIWVFWEHYSKTKTVKLH